MTSSERLDAVADLAALLSIGWDLPTGELAAGLQSGSFLRDVRDCCQELSAPEPVAGAWKALYEACRAGTASEGELLDALRTDRTNLFDVPRRPATSPYESQHADACDGKDEVQLFISQSAMQIKELLDEAGLAEPEHEPADHIARELELLSYFAGQEAATSDNEAVMWASRRRILGADHLGKWVPIWAPNVVREAETAFYRGLADLTNQIMASQILWSKARFSLMGRKLSIFPR